MIIGVDMGHSLSGAGTGASKYVSEVVENRKIGKELIRMLREKGHTVINCTVDKASTSDNQLDQIVANANKQYLDVFISIHLNAGGGKGTETYVVSKNGNAYKYALSVNQEVYESCFFVDRGIKTARFKVITKTVAPALLLEVCFVDTKSDCDKLNCYNVSKAIFKGLTGVDYTESVVSSKTRVVTGFFADRKNAEAQQAGLKIAGFDSFLIAHTSGSTAGFRVVAGTFSDVNNAKILQAQLLEKGFDSYLVTI